MNKYIHLNYLLVFLNSLVVELLSNIFEVLRFRVLNDPCIVFFFSLKPKWCSSVIVYQEQGQVCVHFVLCFYQNEALNPLCEDAHCERQERTDNNYLFT